MMEHIKDNELVDRIGQLITRDVLEAADHLEGKWQIHPVLGRDTTHREADAIRRIVKTVMNETIQRLAEMSIIYLDDETGEALPKSTGNTVFAVSDDGTVDINCPPEEKLAWLFKIIGLLSELADSIIEDVENDRSEEEAAADPDKLPEETPEDVSG